MVILAKPRQLQITLPNRTKVQETVQRYALLTTAALFMSLSYVMFQVPHNLSAGGLGGLSLVMSHYTGLTPGFSFWMMNIPMIILGFFTLGRWQFLARTLYVATLFPFLTDFFLAFLPQFINPFPITDNLLLTTIYAGVVGGFGSGLLFKAKGSMGSTSVITLLVQKKTGFPLSRIYFFSDGLIILISGAVFGWEASLYGFLMLFVYGVVTDQVMEGVSSTVKVSVVTNQLDDVKKALFDNFQKGVSYWEITGGYTGETRYMIMSTIMRSQITEVRRVIAEVDPDAFVTMEMSQQTLGAGFVPLSPRTHR